MQPTASISIWLNLPWLILGVDNSNGGIIKVMCLSKNKKVHKESKKKCLEKWWETKGPCNSKIFCPIIKMSGSIQKLCSALRYGFTNIEDILPDFWG